MNPSTSPAAYVSAGLPDLPGVPATVGPVTCPNCDQRTAVVHHVPRGDGNYSAVTECNACGSRVDLWMNAYAAGLSVGVLIEAARRNDPRIARQP
jgi:hypothetical protein